MAIEEQPPTAEETLTYTTGDTSSPPDIRLLHFNDGKYLRGRYYSQFRLTRLNSLPYRCVIR